MNKVSIIIPVYNAHKNISKCLDSIIENTYKKIEILLINDGSTDNSLAILKEYEKKYEFIKVIDKKNEGVAKTRNLGIKKATGKYIMFIDNDDYIDKDYIKTYVNAVTKNNSDLAIGGFKRVDEEGKILYKQSLKDTYWAKYTIITPWAKIFSREFLLKNKIEFLSYPIGEDVYFNILLYSYKPKTKIINYLGYNWLYNKKSVSNTTHKGLNKKIDIIYFLEEINKLNKNNDKYVNYYIKKFYIWYLLYSGRYASKKEFLKENEKIETWKKSKNLTFISALSPALKGEKLKNRIIVVIFSLLQKTKLLGLFARIYCKGEKEWKK